MSEAGGIVNAQLAATGRTANDDEAMPSPAAIRLSAAPHAVMYSYPWDIYDHGPERVLDELQQCGVDAIQLSFSYHVASFINPRNPRRKVRYGEPGVLEFDPGSSAGTWPFTPAVSVDVTGERYLADLIEKMAARDLGVIAWVVYLYNHTLARRHPELAVENAFGDKSGAQLCPANPAVREYVLSLTDAVLSHTPLTGLVAESLSYLPYDYGFLNLKAAVTPSQSAGLLLSLCFCRHCMQRAAANSVDVVSLRREVVDVIEKEFAELPDGTATGATTEAWCQQNLGLLSLLDSRSEIATSLQQSVLRTARTAGLRTGTNSAGSHDARLTGVPNDAVVELRSDYRFEVLPHWTTDHTGEVVATARQAAGAGAAVYALAQLSNFPDEGSFRSALEAAASLGVDHFRLYEYGLLSERQLTWLRNSKHLWTRPVTEAGGGPVARPEDGPGHDPRSAERKG